MDKGFSFQPLAWMLEGKAQARPCWHPPTLNSFVVCEVFIKFYGKFQIHELRQLVCLIIQQYDETVMYTTPIYYFFLWSILKQLPNNLSFNLLTPKWVALSLYLSIYIYPPSRYHTQQNEQWFLNIVWYQVLVHLSLVIPKIFCGRWLACLNQQPTADNTLHLVNNVF